MSQLRRSRESVGVSGQCSRVHVWSWAGCLSPGARSAVVWHQRTLSSNSTSLIHQLGPAQHWRTVYRHQRCRRRLAVAAPNERSGSSAVSTADQTTSDASSAARRLVGMIVGWESQLTDNDYSGKTYQIAECIAKQRAASNMSVAFLQQDTLWMSPSVCLAVWLCSARVWLTNDGFSEAQNWWENSPRYEKPMDQIWGHKVNR